MSEDSSKPARMSQADARNPFGENMMLVQKQGEKSEGKAMQNGRHNITNEYEI